MMEVNPFIPMIVITADFDQHDQAFAAGVEALIEKPIDVPVFLRIIDGLLPQTSEPGLERVCGDYEYFRYATGHNEVFVKMLNERASAPLKLSSALNAASQPALTD